MKRAMAELYYLHRQGDLNIKSSAFPAGCFALHSFRNNCEKRITDGGSDRFQLGGNGIQTLRPRGQSPKLELDFQKSSFPLTQLNGKFLKGSCCVQTRRGQLGLEAGHKMGFSEKQNENCSFTGLGLAFLDNPLQFYAENWKQLFFPHQK